MLYEYHHQRWFVMLILAFKDQKTYPKFIWVKTLCAAETDQAAEADQAKQKYLEFMSSVVVTAKGKFLSFDHLDSLMGSLMQDSAHSVNSWKVCKIIFISWPSREGL